MPKLTAIDHIHIYVKDRAAAVKWYKEVMGFTPLEQFLFWAKNGGPLTIANDTRTIHLALFENKTPSSPTTTAFSTSAAEFIAWIKHLKRHGIQTAPIDHDLTFSLYFTDPDNNKFEITSFAYDDIKSALNSG